MRSLATFRILPFAVALTSFPALSQIAALPLTGNQSGKKRLLNRRKPRDRVFYPETRSESSRSATDSWPISCWIKKRDGAAPFTCAKDAKWWIAFSALTAALIATDYRTSTALESSNGKIPCGNHLSQVGASRTGACKPQQIFRFSEDSASSWKC